MITINLQKSVLWYVYYAMYFALFFTHLNPSHSDRPGTPFTYCARTSADCKPRFWSQQPETSWTHSLLVYDCCRPVRSNKGKLQCQTASWMVNWSCWGHETWLLEMEWGLAYCQGTSLCPFWGTLDEFLGACYLYECQKGFYWLPSFKGLYRLLCLISKHLYVLTISYV